MEEEEKSPPQSDEMKLFFASYSPQVPSELNSLFQNKSIHDSKNYALIQNYHLEMIETSEKKISLNIYLGESYTDILCEVFEVKSESFENLLNKLQIPDLKNCLKDKKKFQDFKCELFCEGCKISIFYAGEYKKFPLLTMRYIESKKVASSKEAIALNYENFWKEFIIFFKEIFDKNSANLYTRRILSKLVQNKEEIPLSIDNILKEIYFENESILLNKEDKILFDLKTKDFLGEKILELPKFNKATGNFEKEVKIKFKTNE